MFYVFGTKEADGSLTYFKDEAGNSIFEFEDIGLALEGLTQARAVGPNFELHRVISASVNLCECPS